MIYCENTDLEKCDDPRALYGGTAHKYCIFTSRGVRLALVKSNELGISGANGVW